MKHLSNFKLLESLIEAYIAPPITPKAYRELHAEVCQRMGGRNYTPDSQPTPKAGKAEIAPLVIADLEKRKALGIERYGTPLQTHNGRDALVDAYEEALDLVMYLRQHMEEQSEVL